MYLPLILWFKCFEIRVLHIHFHLLLLTDCLTVFTLVQVFGVVFIPKIQLIGCTRVKAGKWHIWTCGTDMFLWFVFGCCICEQAFNDSLDWWGINMPSYTGAVYAWNKWENIGEKNINFLVVSTRFHHEQYLIFIHIGKYSDISSVLRVTV